MHNAWAICILLTAGTLAAPSAVVKPVVLLANSTLIHKHGRWDNTTTTWWAGSGLKVVASNLTSFKLNLGDLTTQPVAAVGLSVDYANYTTINVTAGTNTIPLPATSSKKDRVVRLHVEGYYNNHINLQSIELNAGAVAKAYKPSPLRFQFIGDSLSAGYLNPNGVSDAWTFITSQNFKAEDSIQAQPGACLTDKECYSNPRGMSYLWFQTEDSNYIWTYGHNYTTPWDFKKDLTPTHVFIVIGANDFSNAVTPEDFGTVLTSFVAKVRTVYAKQDIFLFSPWGWPAWQDTLPFSTYFDAIWPAVVANRTAAGDKHIHLVNTTGWVGYDGVIPNDGHPNPTGQLQVAGHLSTWLQNWGLKPRSKWES